MNDGKFRLALVKISNDEVIPEDEPVFILRARDIHALDTLMHYQAVCRAGDCNEYQMEGIDFALKRFVVWQMKNADKMKQPGVTRGA
jgi:hypothetical protein